MPAATVTNSGKAPGAAVNNAAVPFVVGSNLYSERIFSDSVATGANSVEFVHNITPGGFLRGVRLIVRSTGGVIGAATVNADNPWSVLSSVSLENIDGSPIQYPMTGYAYYLKNKYCRPWAGDPAKRYDFASGVNPAFTLFIGSEIRDSAGVLANTDARAQYRLRYSVAPTTGILTGAPTTPPTVTVTGYLETYSQPDDKDLHGNPIQPLPPGLSVGSIYRHDIKVLNAAGADNILQFANTGNEYRCIIAVVRDSNGARQDYLTDPIRFRLDNRSEWTRSPDDQFNAMADFYNMLGLGQSTRETGVYVIPRFRNPGDQIGEFWLPTSNATYVMLESATLGTAVNLPGTVEIITDEVVPVAAVPLELEGI